MSGPQTYIAFAKDQCSDLHTEHRLKAVTETIMPFSFRIGQVKMEQDLQVTHLEARTRYQ